MINRAAQALVYAIRRMGGRIYLEDHGGNVMVLVDHPVAYEGRIRIPDGILNKVPRMKKELVEVLRSPADPEMISRAKMVSEFRLMRHRAVKMEGKRQ